MNTTAAAAQAGVTIPTIRTWCRIGAVAAVKHAGRWVIDAASLAYRIAIGAMRARKQTHMILGSSRSWRTPGQYTVTGDAGALERAFDTGTPVTLSGDFAGDRVYLGITRTTYGDYGSTQETISLESRDSDTATYVIDPGRLADAPRLAALIDKKQAEADAANARLAAQDDDYLDDYYE